MKAVEGAEGSSPSVPPTLPAESTVLPLNVTSPVLQMFPGPHLFYPHVWIRYKLKWRKFTCLVLSLGSALVGHFSASSLRIPSSYKLLGPKSWTLIQHDHSPWHKSDFCRSPWHIFFVSAYLVWADLFSPWGIQKPVSFCKVCRKCGYRNTSQLLQWSCARIPTGPNLLEVYLSTGRLFSSPWNCFILRFHSGGLLASSHHLCQQLGNRKWGRQLRKIPVLSITSFYGSARGES